MNQLNLDEHFIKKVNEIARSAAEKGFDPFGALLVKDQEIVATSLDKCILYSDPTAHAELILISEFCRANKLISLEPYTLYCNVEPCIMCSGAIHWAKISRVVFSIGQSELQSVSKGKQKPSCRELINSGRKQIEIVGNILPDEGRAILKQYPFISKKEKHQKYQKLQKDISC